MSKLVFDSAQAAEELGLWPTQRAFLAQRHRLLVTQAITRDDRRAADDARILRGVEPTRCTEPHCTVRTPHEHNAHKSRHGDPCRCGVKHTIGEHNAQAAR